MTLKHRDLIHSGRVATLTEELRTLEELEQREELAVRALKNLAMRTLLRNLVVRAFGVKHLAYEQVYLPWPSLACL